MHTICLQWSAQIDDQGFKKKKKKTEMEWDQTSRSFFTDKLQLCHNSDLQWDLVFDKGPTLLWTKGGGEGKKKNASGMHGVKKKKKERKKSET